MMVVAVAVHKIRAEEEDAAMACVVEDAAEH